MGSRRGREIKMCYIAALKMKEYQLCQDRKEWMKWPLTGRCVHMLQTGNPKRESLGMCTCVEGPH